MGYSLPVTDLGVTFLLRRNAPENRIPIEVVNLSENVTDRYKDSLGDLYNVQSGPTGETSVQEFVQSLPAS